MKKKTKIPKCPYCERLMDIDSQVVSKEMLLRSTRHESVTKASCMHCVINVVITENLKLDDDELLTRGEPDKVELYIAVLEDIPVENRPAFLTARKAEIEEGLKEAEGEKRQELQMVLAFINQKIKNEPWGDYKGNNDEQ